MTVAVPACYYDPQALEPRNRRDGVSAMLRVRDGAEFLRPGLESCIDVFDEIVAVHHQCSDDTPQILHEYAVAYPDRFKVYEYPHEVFPAGTKEHAEEGPKSPHTIAALCNYALSRTTRRFAVKHDADHLYMPRFAEIVDFIRGGRAGGRSVSVMGVNLARSRAGDLGVHRSRPICGGGDYLIFRVSRDTFYTHWDRYEWLCLPRLRARVFAGFGFWHLKFLQRNYGLNPHLWRYEPHDTMKEIWACDESVPDKRRSQVGRDQWRGFIANYERGLEVISLEEFIALFGGRDSPFISEGKPRWPRRGDWKSVSMYFVSLMMSLMAPLALSFADVYCKIPPLLMEPMMPYLRTWAARRDLCGLSPPAESDLRS